LKVLFLSNELGPGRSNSAYTHRLTRLMQSLRDHAIDTDFLSLRELPAGRPILAQALNAPLLRARVADCDFVHGGGNAAYTAVFLKPFTRARVIHDVHGDGVSEARIKASATRSWRGLYEIAQAWVADTAAYRFADYALVVSKPSWRRLVDEKHVPADRIGLVRNGVDLAEFDRPPKLRSRDGELVVCYAGGFQAWQGVDSLISAIERLESLAVRLKVIGFTPEQEAIRADIARRLGGRAVLLDKMPRHQLIAELAGADVLVIPRPRHRAVEVAFPTKFGEYLALAKPVVVCDVDETADLVREHRCGLVSEPTPAGLADALRTMAELAPGELRRMGCNARRLAECELSWDIVGRKYAELLRQWSTLS